MILSAKKVVIGMLLVAACALVASADAGAGSEADAAVQYMASIPPLAMIIGRLAEGRAQVGTLLAPGMSPHTYDPRPSDVVAVNRAEAVFYAGGELDQWVTGIGDANRIAVLPLVPDDSILMMEEHSHADMADSDHAHGHGHEHHHHHAGPEEHSGDAHAVADPHFWTSPSVVQSVLPALTEKLTELDPQGAATYEQNAVAFSEELLALEQEIADLLEPYRGGELILFHPSFQYFAADYGLEVSAVVQPVAGVEPSARYVVELIERIEHTEHCALFTEPQLPPDAADTIADATGMRVYELDPLGGTAELGSYVELITHNAEVIAQALSAD